MALLMGFAFGFAAWFVLRWGLLGFYTVQPDERAVKTTFGRAKRVGDATIADSPLGEHLSPEERKRYAWPQVEVIPPGGPYFKWPWEKVHKVSVATQTHSLPKDPESPSANHNGTMLDAVTKDQLNTGLKGQIRYRVSEQNLYAYVFGVRGPIIHVLGYFISILRERIANYEAPKKPSAADDGQLDASDVTGISINDLRKNLRDINDHMDRECLSSAARYGIVLDASLITEIDPPQEVEAALAAINTAHNEVSSDISLAQASADQKIVQSRRAVEIETLNAQAEVEPLLRLAEQLGELKARGEGALEAYIRNLKVDLFAKADRTFLEVRR